MKEMRKTILFQIFGSKEVRIPFKVRQLGFKKIGRENVEENPINFSVLLCLCFGDLVGG